MEKRQKLIISAALITATTVLGTVMLARRWAPVLSKSSESSYTLSLRNQKISNQTSSYTEEISATVSTTGGAPITIKASNVIANSSGWQTILPGGYFYNPIDNSSFKNKINGLTSISFQASGSDSLTLYYGQTINNTQVIYSHERTLSPGLAYNLSDELPTYFYIKNNTNNNINISEFTFNYTCSPSEYQKQNLDVLMIGNSFADDTLFYANRIAAAYGININLYDAYIAGCTINTHWANLQSGGGEYSMRNIVNGGWNYADNMSLTSIINSRTWDIITFQQASAEVGR